MRPMISYMMIMMNIVNNPVKTGVRKCIHYMVTMKTSKSIKFLGNGMNPQLNNAAVINNLVKNIEYRTMVMKRIKYFTTITQRKKISNAVSIDKLNKMLSTYTNATVMQNSSYMSV